MITVVQTNELRRVNVDVDEQGASITITPQVQEVKVEVSIDTLLLSESFAQQAIISAGQSSQSAILSEASKVASGLSEQNSIAQALLSSQKAEESRLSALLAEDQVDITVENAAVTVQNAAVSTQKLTETLELTTQALTSKNASGLSATAAEGFATASEAASITSTQQAILSASARNDAEAAKLAAQNSEDVSTEQAAIATTKATESAGSAADAEAAKNLILNKAEVNVTTAGNILLADGTLFKSVPDRDLGANLSLYQRTPLLFDKPSILELYDNCERIGTTSNEPMGQADSGQSYVNLVGSSGKYNGLSRNLFSNTANGDIIGIENFNVLPNIFLTRSGFVRIGSGSRSGIYFYVDANNWVFFGVGTNLLLVITKVSGVETIVRSVAVSVVLTRSQLKMHFFLAPQNVGYGLTIPDANLTCFIGTEVSTLSIINQATAIGFSGTIYNYSITVAKSF